jgi:hypothetical protein
MRNLTIISILLAMAVMACEEDNNTTDPYTEVTVSMGSNSADDVYYSMANGTIHTVTRTDWDLAFSVPMQSATVLINEGAGVELYCAGDTTDWDLIDENTVNDLTAVFNDNSDWSIGAFNHFPSGVFNFGWGTYNMTDHNVYGDSIYIIKLSDGSLKKFFYKKRIGGTAVHHLRWADLDGSNLVNTTFASAAYFGTRHFIHYSLVNQEVVEAEPALDQWDVLFTRYIIQIPAGPGVIMNYPVMGVVSNPDVTVARVTGVAPDKAMDTDATAGYSEAKDAIGYDWKVSDPVTHAISLVDSTSYFIQSVDGKKYQVYFTGYGGNSEGSVTFKYKIVQ